VRSLLPWIVVATACSFRPSDAPPRDATTTIDTDGPANAPDSPDGVVVPPGWWNPAWTKRSEVEIDNTNVSAELDNFPVLVTLTPAAFDYASSTGADVRFVAADNTTMLAYDVDTFASGSTSQIWVSVPAIAAAPSAHTTFWIYYGNPGATDASDPKTVWSEFVSVHHLLDGNDATQNNHTGTVPSGDTPTTATAGLVGAAQSFNGTSQAMGLATPTDFDFKSFTIGLWINSNAFTADYQCFFCKGDSEWRLQRADANPQAEFGTTDTGQNNVDGTSTVDDNHWHFIVATFDANNDFKKILYVDGALQGSDNAAALAMNTYAAVIGENQEATTPAHRYFSGTIDEVRTTATVRNANWIATEYAMIAGATAINAAVSAIVTLHPVQSL
jgi:biopolymer transport protein ExbB